MTAMCCLVMACLAWSCGRVMLCGVVSHRVVLCCAKTWLRLRVAGSGCCDAATSVVVGEWMSCLYHVRFLLFLCVVRFCSGVFKLHLCVV